MDTSLTEESTLSESVQLNHLKESFRKNDSRISPRESTGASWGEQEHLYSLLQQLIKHFLSDLFLRLLDCTARNREHTRGLKTPDTRRNSALYRDSDIGGWSYHTQLFSCWIYYHCTTVMMQRRWVHTYIINNYNIHMNIQL